MGVADVPLPLEDQIPLSRLLQFVSQLAHSSSKVDLVCRTSSQLLYCFFFRVARGPCSSASRLAAGPFKSRNAPEPVLLKSAQSRQKNETATQTSTSDMLALKLWARQPQAKCLHTAAYCTRLAHGVEFFFLPKDFSCTVQHKTLTKFAENRCRGSLSQHELADCSFKIF